ncbi:aldehyde dehydrogenase family protein [Actinomadura madurae]|uniref:aldehyde dehydrogenase family protein n=1 Tax=Actinomadura madurae TaxID=1993 RepID=UPI0020D2245B
MASHPQGLVLPSAQPRWSLARRRPAGVVTVIAPFNFPLILSMRSVAPGAGARQRGAAEAGPPHGGVRRGGARADLPGGGTARGAAAPAARRARDR